VSIETLFATSELAPMSNADPNSLMLSATFAAIGIPSIANNILLEPKRELLPPARITASSTRDRLLLVIWIELHQELPTPRSFIMFGDELCAFCQPLYTTQKTSVRYVFPPNIPTALPAVRAKRV
jgi:hypothetical protein